MTITLSKRLEVIASFLPKGAYFADIGTDHAYLPCYVCLKDETAMAIAGEVNQGPYERAKATVKKFQLEDKIDVRLGNGLKIIEPKTDPIEQIVIAGMGGPLIRDILDSGLNELSTVKRLILQPNVASTPLRKWLYEKEFSIVHELIVAEKGHLYEVMIADQGAIQPYAKDPQEREKQMMFGPFLMKEKSSLFLKKWQNQLNHLQKITKGMKKAKKTNGKLKDFLQQIQWIEEVLNDE